MSKRPSLLAALVGVGLLAPGLARADKVLTLQEAFKLGEQNNLDLGAARVHLQQSELGIKQAFAALFPQVNLQGKYTHNYRNIDYPLSPEHSVTILKGEQIDSSLMLMMPIYSPVIFPGLDAAKQSNEVSKDGYAVTKQQVLFGVAQAFYAAAGTDELLAARKHAIEVAKETLNQSQTRFQSGFATRLDVSRAELAVVQAEKAADEAAEMQDGAYRSLATLIQFREPFKVASADAVATTPAGTSVRPEVTMLEDSIKLADMEATVARKRWWPMLSLFGRGTLGNYAGFTGDNYSWALGLQLDWTIFDGGVRDVQAKQAESMRVETELRLKQQNDAISDEVANAKRAVETKTRSLTAAQRATELSKEALDLVRVRYEAGQATQLDVLQAQDQLVMSEVGLAQARFDLALSNLALERASGSFLAHATDKAVAAQ